MNRARQWVWLVAAMAAGAAGAELAVTNVTVAQRWPWENKVDIQYQILCDDPAAEIHVFFSGVDQDRQQSVMMLSLSGAGASGPVTAGVHRLVWDAGGDMGDDFHAASFAMRIEAVRGDALYMIVDLSGGPTATNYPVTFTPNLPDPIPCSYRTTNLVLRYCPPGAFSMGSPADELGHSSEEDMHFVTLTRPFYIGVFEVTQRQWELVMGGNPSGYRGDVRPVERVSHAAIRGSDDGAGWPAHNRVDPDSFVGRLRIRCNLLFDLPTEAQWEYACRAGTTTALNSGKNLTGVTTCPNLAEVGRYKYNQTDGRGGYSPHTAVGSYLPNQWCLFDMHANVWEWCLDRWATHLGNNSVTDPKGAMSGGGWVIRGGCYAYPSMLCRSAKRAAANDLGYDGDSNYGFRLAFFPVGQ